MAKLVAAGVLMAAAVVGAWMWLTTGVVGWPVHAEMIGIPLVVLYFVAGLITSDSANPEIYLYITAMASGFLLILGFVPGLPGHLRILAFMTAGGVVGSFIVGVIGGIHAIERSLGRGRDLQTASRQL